MRRFPALILSLLLLLSGCATSGPDRPPAVCRVVLEEGEGFTAQAYVQETEYGGSIRFELHEKDGYRIEGSDASDATLTRDLSGVYLDLSDVKYTEVVRLAVKKSDEVLRYHAAGGIRLDGGSPDQPVEVPVTPSHLRLNTSLGTDLFRRDGYTLIGWNSEIDGSGTETGLGSRVASEDGMILYAQWRKWTDSTSFDWEADGAGVCVTGYHGADSSIIVPAMLDGKPVQRIGNGAFANVRCTEVILPETLITLEDGAFEGCTLQALWLFDSIRDISDYGFSDCRELQTLHINAAVPPVFSGTYYAAFPDKLDRLITLRDRQKIVLFSGSSTRFGYDSSKIDEAFPDYEVVNMGVFAYTNALPQFEIMLNCMKEGDILIHSPEFDAAQRQFCTNNNLDAAFFNMVECDYDAVSMLDLRNYGQIFTPFHTFLVSRDGMPPVSYGLSPGDFDEDGNPVNTRSYNAYGDYILYRPNSPEDTPVYGLPVKYTPEAIPYDSFIQPLNRVYRLFLDRGVRVYMTYSPRNKLAVSDDTTPDSIRALDRHLRDTLCVPVISDIEGSLVSGRYLYGTDNHLSTEGVAIRTNQIIDDLKSQLSQEE